MLSPYDINVDAGGDGFRIVHYLPAAERALDELIKSLGLPFLNPGKVILQRHMSHSDAVNALVNYAEMVDADLIFAMSTVEPD